METDGVAIGRTFSAKARTLRTADEIEECQRTRNVFRRLDGGKEVFIVPSSLGPNDRSSQSHGSSLSQTSSNPYYRHDPNTAAAAVGGGSHDPRAPHGGGGGYGVPMGMHMMGAHNPSGHMSAPMSAQCGIPGMPMSGIEMMSGARPHHGQMGVGMGGGGEMRGADIRGADMRGADTRGGDMRGGDVRGGDSRNGSTGINTRSSSPQASSDSSTAATGPPSRLRVFRSDHLKLRSKLNDLSWTANGARLLISARSAVYITDWKTMTVEHTLTGRSISKVICHPIHPHLFVVLSDIEPTIRLYDLRTLIKSSAPAPAGSTSMEEKAGAGEAQLKTSLGHIDSAAWRSDGKVLVITDRSDMVQCINTEHVGSPSSGSVSQSQSQSSASATGSSRHPLALGPKTKFPTDVNGVCFDGRDGDLLMVATAKGRLELFPCQPMKKSIFNHSNQFSLEAQLFDVTAVAADPTGQYFATGGADQSISLFSLDNLTHVASVPRCGGDVSKIAFNSRGSLLAWTVNCRPVNSTQRLVDALQKFYAKRGSADSESSSTRPSSPMSLTPTGIATSSSASSTPSGRSNIPLEVSGPVAVGAEGQESHPQPPPAPVLYLAGTSPLEFQWMSDVPSPIMDIAFHPSLDIVAYVCETISDVDPVAAAASIVSQIRGRHTAVDGQSASPASSTPRGHVPGPVREDEPCVAILFMV